MLDLAYDGLRAEGGLVPEDVASLVHLSSVLLRDAPEGEYEVSLPVQSLICRRDIENLPSTHYKMLESFRRRRPLHHLAVPAPRSS